MRVRDGELRRRWGGLPWGLALALGVVCVLVGLLLVLRPFLSLAATVVLVVVALAFAGISDLAAASRAEGRWPRAVAGVAWLAVAVGVAVWPGPSVRVLAVAVGVGMVLVGVLDLVAAARGDSATRLADGVLAAAGLVLGVLALAWPDVTLFVVAVVLGLRLVLLGAGQVRDAWRRRRAPARAAAAPSGSSPRTRRTARTVGAFTALAGVLGLLALSVTLHTAAPRPDAFYDPPADVPSEPGALLRDEPFTRKVPDGARAWRILYTTTRADGVPAVASGIVLVGDGDGDGDSAGAATPRPVLAWAHGTTGTARGCAPSVLDEPFSSGAMPALDDVARRGWVLVATDYVGLGTASPHPYLVGESEGRAVLDAVRAARDLDDVVLSDETVVWGHSQGGHAALWTRDIAADYAPDVPLGGVAALAPASDLPAFVGELAGSSAGVMFGSYLVQSYAQVYPDVDADAYVRPVASVVSREIAERCLSEPSTLVSVASILLGGSSIWSAEPTDGALGERLAENVPAGDGEAPLLLAQGLADDLILPAMQDAYVDGLCAAGGDVEYRTYAGRDHVGVVAADSPLVPDLLAWTEDRFAGAPTTSTC